MNPLPIKFLASAFLIFSLGIGGGCSAPQFEKTATPAPHDFIHYTPSAEENGRLRLAVKDLIDMKGEVTSAGSKYLADNGKPAKRDAACLAIARERGVTFVGKTNLSEFAVGVSGSNDYFGTPENPITKKRNLIPGGSSSGSAVAVALGKADVALGTDTAGSIRVPAACCGISGLKTTFGLVSLEGIYPISPEHLDTVGPMARDVEGLVEGMGLLQRGFAGLYAKAKSEKPTAGTIKVGRLYIPGTRREIDDAIDRALVSKGFEVVVMTNEFYKHWKQAKSDGNTVASVGAWLTNKDFLFSPKVSLRAKAVLLLGEINYVTSYKKALGRKKEWQRVLAQAFREVDVIALPTLKDIPFKIPILEAQAAFEARVLASQNTVPVNLAGNPALALPVPIEDEKVPVTSVQLVGRPRGEADLLNVGRLLESK